MKQFYLKIKNKLSSVKVYFLVILKLGEVMNILITGGTSGIGFDAGINLAKIGHFVYLTTHYSNQVASVKEKVRKLGLDKKMECFCLDITKEADRRKIFDLDIDCLINNAAIGIGGSVLDLDIEKVKNNFEVNVFSTMEMIQTYAASLFLKKKKGRVVVVSSLAGIIPLPFMGSYSATKSALITLTTAFNRELSFIKSELEVCLIEPGIYLTGFNEVMIDNKEISTKESVFNNIYPSVSYYQKKLFNTFGKKDTSRISKKIVSAATSKHPKFLYRAPFFQVVGAKLYMLLFK